MEFEIIYKLTIPIILVGIGIWLKNTEEDSLSKIKEYWFLFIIIGILQLIMRVYINILN